MLNTADQRNANQTPMRYQLTIVRMAVIKKNANNEYWQGCREKEDLVLC